MTLGEHNFDVSARQAHAEATYERLFGPRDKSAPHADPELMEILRRFIFGDVFDTGVLDDQTRELITVTVLACLQTLPQLKSHTAAALNVGVEPVEIREAIYQLAHCCTDPAVRRSGAPSMCEDDPRGRGRRRRRHQRRAEPSLDLTCSKPTA